MQLDQILSDLSAARTDEVVIATMTAAYLWPRHSSSARDFCYIAPMGSAAAIGLGLALARPELRVWVFDGDGSLLMNLGVLVTIAKYRPANLVHLVMGNGVYAITGGQPVVGDGTPRLAALANAAGWHGARTVTTSDQWRDFLTHDLKRPGPVFAEVRVDPAYDRDAARDYTHHAHALRTQGGPGFHHLRQVLQGD